MKFNQICEEVVSFLDSEGDNEILMNPGPVELNKLVRKMGKDVRIIASEKTKNVYVFNSDSLHFQACRMIEEFQPILKFITASGEVEDGKITLTDSDVLRWNKFNSDTRREIMKSRDWSFVNKYLNNDIKIFLKHLKIKS